MIRNTGNFKVVKVTGNPYTFFFFKRTLKFYFSLQQNICGDVNCEFEAIFSVSNFRSAWFAGQAVVALDSGLT